MRATIAAAGVMLLFMFAFPPVHEYVHVLQARHHKVPIMHVSLFPPWNAYIVVEGDLKCMEIWDDVTRIIVMVFSIAVMSVWIMEVIKNEL